MYDLALALGGMTVGELKRRVTNDELLGWILYIQECGPLNPSLRIEAAIGRGVVPFLKGAKVRDFMPWPKQPEREATIDDFMSILKAARKPEKP